MKLNINTIHFAASQDLKEYTQKKMDKLETYFSNILDGEVIFKVEKNQTHHNKIIEIKLNIPQNQLFAKDKASSFEEGVSSCTEALRRQLMKLKDKN